MPGPPIDPWVYKQIVEKTDGSVRYGSWDDPSDAETFRSQLPNPQEYEVKPMRLANE